MMSRLRSLAGLVAVVLALSLGAADFADAAKVRSFGSRGTRTYDAPAATTTAPTSQSINRSMTQPSAQSQGSAMGAQAAQPSRGMFGGFGGIMGGLLVGGLIGSLLGHGFGGMAGMLGMILQLGIAFLVISMLFKFFRNRQSPAMAGGAPRMGDAPQGSGLGGGLGGMGLGGLAGGLGGAGAARKTARQPDEIGIVDGDYAAFEQLLKGVHDAFAREDFNGLRAVATPEIVSYLSEEMAENASAGVKNTLTHVELLQGDLSESWREDSYEYATVAMRYGAIDVTRNRATGAITEGSDTVPAEFREIWTFVRERGAAWKLSAIQQA